jgi:hypothetical protein
MIPSTVTRVPRHTSKHVNEQIRRDTEDRVAQCAAGGRKLIDRRLAELDQEWDVERTLEANAATASLMGLTLGATVNRKWFIFPAAVAAFLLQHAVQGWCPPLPVLRRLGFRTASEIDYERYALKSIRGDFRNLRASNGDPEASAEEVVETMRR